ncbi:hypothetical protein B0H13DRAFT_1909398 [Mycena leptocephala]|nr:hypothetical protein B0H13DRAFT_1909398 [Mycena leptocephala]
MAAFRFDVAQRCYDLRIGDFATRNNVRDRVVFTGQGSRYGFWDLPTPAARNPLESAVGLRPRSCTIQFASEYLRFMQAATGCIVGGTFVSTYYLRGTIPAPPTLDIFCPRGLATELLRFLANCDPCALASPVAPGNRKSHQSRGCISSPKLVDSAFMSMSAQQPPISRHGTLNGIWHGYPTATSAGIFLSSPKRLFLDTERNKMFASSLLRFLVAKGLKFSPSWTKPHLCARHPACPSTYRTSQDDGCLLIRFPSSFPVAGADDAQHHHKESVGWILGEWRCEVNLVESVSGDLPVITATYDTDLVWLFNIYRACSSVKRLQALRAHLFYECDIDPPQSASCVSTVTVVAFGGCDRDKVLYVDLEVCVAYSYPNRRVLARPRLLADHERRSTLIEPVSPRFQSVSALVLWSFSPVVSLIWGPSTNCLVSRYGCLRYLSVNGAICSRAFGGGRDGCVGRGMHAVGLLRAIRSSGYMGGHSFSGSEDRCEFCLYSFSESRFGIDRTYCSRRHVQPGAGRPPIVYRVPTTLPVYPFHSPFTTATKDPAKMSRDSLPDIQLGMVDSGMPSHSCRGRRLFVRLERRILSGGFDRWASRSEPCRGTQGIGNLATTQVDRYNGSSATRVVPAFHNDAVTEHETRHGVTFVYH